MDSWTRNRIEKQLRQIMGDNCTICGAEFQHNTRTFGGLTAERAVALVGECCADKIKQGVLAGLYTNRNNHDFKPGTGGERKERSSEEIERGLSALQEGFAARDNLVKDVKRRAGISSNNMQLELAATPWKSDDAKWFTTHPSRSHRLRSLIGNEGDTIPPIYFEALPPNHEVQILVRQVEPGKRARLPFGRNLAIPIPDDEEIIHALFDVVSKGGRKESVIDIREVTELANKYAASRAT